MQKAYFESIGSRLGEVLTQARRSVHIAMAWFTNGSLFDELLRCLDRGVRVDLIILDDAINWQPYAPDFSKILSYELGTIRIASANNVGFMHHKFCVVDSKIVTTGSYNWTYYAESRNVENIIITDDSNVVAQYEDEFCRLRQMIAPTNNCPKYTQEDIEQLEYVDYDILNYEIRQAARVQHQAHFPVYNSRVSVTVIEKKCKPVSKYDLGVAAEKGDDTDVMAPIIFRGTPLPVKQERCFIAYKDERDRLNCDLLYGTSKKASENKRLKTRSITEITEGSHAEEFNISIKISLSQNGDLDVEIGCDETNKIIKLNTTNDDLVKDER